MNNPIRTTAPTFNEFMKKVFEKEEKLMTKKEFEHFHNNDTKKALEGEKV